MRIATIVASILLAASSAFSPLGAQDETPPQQQATTPPENAPPAGDCALKLYATIDLKAEPSNRVVFPVAINGHQLLFMLDTGSPVSVLSGPLVKAFGIPIDIDPSRRMFENGATGAKIVMAAKVSDFEIGGMKGKDFIFGIVPVSLLDPGIAGYLGADVIRNFDIELDFAANRMKLFSPDHCPGNVTYWTHAPHAAVPFEFDGMHHLVIPVTVDGVRLSAQVDTGAPPAIDMNFDAARALFGWYANPPVLTTVNEERGYYSYNFDKLSLGGASVHAPTARLEKNANFGAAQVLVGLEALKAFHVYISYKDKTIYLTARDAH